jgi:hypothetical protein
VAILDLASLDNTTANGIIITCILVDEGSYRHFCRCGDFSPGWPDDLANIRKILWKVAKTVAKIQNMILNSLFQWKCNKFVAHFGAISSMSLQKVALLVKNIAQSGHPAFHSKLWQSKSFLRQNSKIHYHAQNYSGVEARGPWLRWDWKGLFPFIVALSKKSEVGVDTFTIRGI